MSETVKTYDAAAGEPMPTGNGVDVAVVAAQWFKNNGYDEIAEDIEARIRLGERKYGTRLKAFNGRVALMDLYQEVLDAINYAQQCVIEDKPDKVTAQIILDKLQLLAVQVQGHLKHGEQTSL